MSKNDIRPEDKILAVQQYLDGKYPKAELPASFRPARHPYSNGYSTTKAWGVKYFFKIKNKRYSKELKECAVHDHLAGKGSQEDICRRYGIRSKGKMQI